MRPLLERDSEFERSDRLGYMLRQVRSATYSDTFERDLALPIDKSQTWACMAAPTIAGFRCKQMFGYDVEA